MQRVVLKGDPVKSQENRIHDCYSVETGASIIVEYVYWLPVVNSEYTTGHFLGRQHRR